MNKVKDKRINTYISLFSSAGVGCYGFKMEGFNCIASNELIERRLEIQKFNKKCKYDTGYICGDITREEIKNKLRKEVLLWKNNENIKRVDVIIATPPCQGMSVANHKKKEKEIVRNSLVIESIKLIKEINPKIFIFENVPAFMKTICTDIDGTDKTIEEAINNNLSDMYSYVSKIINFKNYGACSSRQRTLVIGVAKDIADDVSPYELYPDIQEEKTLKSVIGDLKSLNNMGEFDKDDFYHSFRVYPEEMRSWIHNLNEGQSAFDNKDDNLKPHQVINGKFVINKKKNADKYTRQFWNKVGPCIHTRNDQLASQNTIHPKDDRVFSIRELMLMMTVPKEFKWVNMTLDELNNLSICEKQKMLKKEEIKIRQSLGEAVPTEIFRQIAYNIKRYLSFEKISKKEIQNLIIKNKLNDINNLLNFIKHNDNKYSIPTLSKIAELTNNERIDDAAYFTNRSLVTEMMKNLPCFDKDVINVLEPSVGVGNIALLLLYKYNDKTINLDVCDINNNMLKVFKLLLKIAGRTKKINLRCINDDFLIYNFDKHYDLVIGNPPFNKTLNKDKNILNIYKKNAKNKDTSNICSYFLDKSFDIADYISFVFPKFILNTPEFAKTREYLSNKSIDVIIDFGENGFDGILIETILINIDLKKKPANTRIISLTKKVDILQKQKYICDCKLPYWIIYRNDKFDKVSEKLDFGVFKVFRDRQITNSILNNKGNIRVIKSRNISNDGEKLLSIDGYDAYISKEKAEKLSVYMYIDANDLYMAPNMTYYPRVMKKPKGVLVNGSVALLIPKSGIKPTKKQLLFFSSQEYRDFYKVARNYQTRSLNIDNCSVYFYGLLK